MINYQWFKMTEALKLIGLLAFGSGLSVVSVAEEVTFHKDIEPILQRSCQNCHREGGVGPMPLVTFDQVAPFAGLIEYKTGLRDRAGAMPPWYMEKNIGIQGYKNDPSLSDAEIAAISTWARNGTPKGDPLHSPEPLVFDDSLKWTAGEPDPSTTVSAGRPADCQTSTPSFSRNARELPSISVTTTPSSVIRVGPPDRG